MGFGIGDVTTVFALFAALGVVFPGLLLAWFLLMPGMVERSRERVFKTPWKALVLGVMVMVIASDRSASSMHWQVPSNLWRMPVALFCLPLGRSARQASPP